MPKKSRSGDSSVHFDSGSTRDAGNRRGIRDALSFIEDHYGERISLAKMAMVAGMSKYHFLRMFRLELGLTPYQYLLNSRLRRVASRLANTSDPVSFIAWENGFRDLSTFNGHFRRMYGLTPLAHRRKSSNAETGKQRHRRSS
jgi:AraC family transcriptional regulator